MYISFYTLGCKVNQYESQAIFEVFKNEGYTLCEPSENTNILVVNSCTVTAESDRKTKQAVRRFKKKCQNAVIVLTGCMPQAFKELGEELLEADIVVGNNCINDLPKLIKEFKQNGKRIVKIKPHTKDECFSTPTVTDFCEHTRAFLKIQDGCERFCTYCIIPKARGFVRSKSLEEIKSEATALADQGFLEIVLVGINLSAYGKGTNYNLADAVETVCEIDGIKRVRLGSIEPDHITNDMLLRFNKSEKFCPQFHLSLQSGCDATLKRMNRHYDTAFYRDLVNRIRSVFDNPSITTDIMVGFAGETEEDFNKSVEFLYDIGFAKAHVFAYSRRKGTPAYSYDNQITNAVKAERSKKMITAAEDCEKQFLQTQIGKTLSVLFETFDGIYAYGYTKNYCRVKLKSNTTLENQLITVKITDLDGETLIAKK